MLCSGYLFAFRRALIGDIPVDALAEDAVISHEIASAGYRIRYALGGPGFRPVSDHLPRLAAPEGALCWRLCPGTTSANRPSRCARRGWKSVRAHDWPSPIRGTQRELAWTLLLFAARLHLWLLVFWNVRVRHRPLKALWQRVETTKRQCEASHVPFAQRLGGADPAGGAVQLADQQSAPAPRTWSWRRHACHCGR